jgi:hypothetical protein
MQGISGKNLLKCEVANSQGSGRRCFIRRQGAAINLVPQRKRFSKAFTDGCLASANCTTNHKFSIIINVIGDLRCAAAVTILKFYDAPIEIFGLTDNDNMHLTVPKLCQSRPNISEPIQTKPKIA